MEKKDKTERQYWVWVTTPEYYLDGGNEIPARKNYNWTCHKYTRKGDLILLYRTHPRKDIGYLIQAKDQAYENLNKEEVKNKNWPYLCNCRFIYKFNAPLKIAEMRTDSYLSEYFSVLRACFRKKAYRVSPSEWKYLSEVLAKKNPSYREILSQAEGL